MRERERECVVLCMAQNEGRYLREFCKYHLDLGFDKIIIGDNNHIDGEKYDVLLNDFIKNGTVEIIDIRGKEAYQLPFYNNFLLNGDYEWCAFIDCDEFITFSDKAKNKYGNNIKNFLRSRDNVNVYVLNWKCYGDNNLTYYEDKPVVERFKYPMSYDFKFHYVFPENFHVKSIVNKKCGITFFEKQPHCITYNTIYSPNGTQVNNSPFNVNLDYDIVFIRHYYTKSLQEWVEKKMISDNVFTQHKEGQIWYPLSDYFIYNEMSEEKKNYLIQKGLIE